MDWCFSKTTNSLLLTQLRNFEEWIFTINLVNLIFRNFEEWILTINHSQLLTDEMKKDDKIQHLNGNI